uniref:Uncharacterized protein n=1 Tax=Echinococcus granulosus TaxID=6210 RepID=A0A068WBE7_ECHGR|nr:hypothetical protein EgrG_000975300 [Echinococcus granulosus]
MGAPVRPQAYLPSFSTRVILNSTLHCLSLQHYSFFDIRRLEYLTGRCLIWPYALAMGLFQSPAIRVLTSGVCRYPLCPIRTSGTTWAL